MCHADSASGRGFWDASIPGSVGGCVLEEKPGALRISTGGGPGPCGLRTRDGGGSWERLESVQPIAGRSPSAKYSWSGKTLAISKNPSIFWVSQDDGDTWLDVSSDYTALQGGLAQWYENTLYVCSLGQGISAKVFNETER